MTGQECGQPSTPWCAWIAVENKAPYGVNVFYPDDDFLRSGDERMRNALRLFKACTESGVWPGTRTDQTACLAEVAAVSTEQPRMTADESADILANVIEQRARAHGEVFDMSPKQIDTMKKIVWATVQVMQESTAFNARMNNLPPAALFCVLVESIARWSRAIDVSIRCGGSKDITLN